MAEESGVVQAGRVGRPHGLDGSVHVSDPGGQQLAKGSTVFVDGEPREIVRRAGTDSSPIIRLAGSDSRDDAARLTGKQLTVARPAGETLGADEWWVEDLVGCSVVDAGATLGVVEGVVGLPSCEALEVRQPSGALLMIPMVSDAVRSVSIKEKLIDADSRFLGLEHSDED